jgi:DnaA-homolog protein
MSFQSPYAAQVPLPFFGPYVDPQSFELYFPGANREAYQCLLELCDTASPLSLYLWGGPGSGKSHLLQATCQRFYERGRQAAYLPLSQIPEWSPAVLEGLESLDLVGLDEIDCLAGRSEWELALLHLYNRLGDSARPLIMAGRIHPQGLSIKRADLKSRLLGSLVFHLQGLNDEAKVMSLQQRAGARGFELPLEVARYLLKHYPRDMKALCCLLDTLDRASLVAQRRLTIPFVRALLES